MVTVIYTHEGKSYAVQLKSIDDVEWFIEALKAKHPTVKIEEITK